MEVKDKVKLVEKITRKEVVTMILSKFGLCELCRIRDCYKILFEYRLIDSATLDAVNEELNSRED